VTPTAAAAVDAIRRGWAPIPAPAGEKAPRIPGWGNLRLTLADVPGYFSNNENIGIILGAASGGLVDIDLDCQEAIEIADLYLPATQAEFGRTTKLRSHRLFISSGVTKETFADPLDGAMLLELRSDGRDSGHHQTIFPPSIHPSGEQITWVGDVIAPAVFDASKLRMRAAWLAAGCLVMRYISPTAARTPAPDLLRLLWEFDHDLARPAYAWTKQAPPDATRNRRPHRTWAQRDLNLAEIVKSIPNNCDWEDWNRIGLAIFATSGGSEEGFVIFDDWSAKSAKYNPYHTANKWAAFRRCPPTRIGAGTLVHLTRQAGWRPSRTARQ
jgi:hypothetical protein